MECQDQFDSIDFSDNAIVFLEGFPKLNRLKALLLNNNRISRIGRHLYGIGITSHADRHALYGVADSLPSLEMLILTNNKIEQLQVNGVMIHNRSFSLCVSLASGIGSIENVAVLESSESHWQPGDKAPKLPVRKNPRLMAGGGF